MSTTTSNTRSTRIQKQAQQLERMHPLESFGFTPLEIDAKEDRNNLLLQSLPPPLSMEEFLMRVARLPIHSKADRKLSTHERERRIALLEDVYVPVAQSYRIYTAIDMDMRAGYRRRNLSNRQPLDQLYAKNQGSIYYRDLKRRFDAGSCLFVPGVTGGGKSKLIEGIVALYQQHTNHAIASDGEQQFVQIPILYVPTAGSKSFKALALEFATALDVIVPGNSFSAGLRRESAGNARLKDLMAQACRAYSIGMIILDECQDLVGRVSPTEGKEDSFVAMLMSLRTSSETPIAYFGNYGMVQGLQLTGRFTRRHCSGGFSIDRYMEGDPDWDYMVDTYWDASLVQNPTKLDDSLRELIYMYTQGIPSFLRTLIVSANKCAFDNDEVIDAKTLAEGYALGLNKSHVFIMALAAGDREALSQFVDFYNPFEGRNLTDELAKVMKRRKFQVGAKLVPPPASGFLDQASAEVQS